MQPNDGLYRRYGYDRTSGMLCFRMEKPSADARNIERLCDARAHRRRRHRLGSARVVDDAADDGFVMVYAVGVHLITCGLLRDDRACHGPGVFGSSSLIRRQLPESLDKRNPVLAEETHSVAVAAQEVIERGLQL